MEEKRTQICFLSSFIPFNLQIPLLGDPDICSPCVPTRRTIQNKEENRGILQRLKDILKNTSWKGLDVFHSLSALFKKNTRGPGLEVVAISLRVYFIDGFSGRGIVLRWYCNSLYASSFLVNLSLFRRIRIRISCSLEYDKTVRKPFVWYIVTVASHGHRVSDVLNAP